MALPIGITQQRNMVLRRICGDEVEPASYCGGHSQDGEEIGRNPRPRHPLRLTRSCAVQAYILHSRYSAEDMLLPDPLLKIHVGGGDALANGGAEGWVLLPNHHQPVGIA